MATIQKTYKVGQKPTLKVTITVDGTATNPASLNFRMREPDGTETTYVYGTDDELVRDATGIYSVEWLIEQEGVHHYRFWNPSGAATGADEWSFTADWSLFSP